MTEPGALALRLSEASDTPTAAERLAEHIRLLVPGGAARVYLLGPGDKCSACARSEDCPAKDRCLHLEAGLGAFSRPRMLDQRVPLGGTAWGDVLDSTVATGEHPGALGPLPPELQGGPTHEGQSALLLPLEAGGEIVGIVGVRGDAEELEAARTAIEVAAFLTATSIRLLRSLSTANRRFEQLLLVNELGRKVNAILNDELLLRQAAVEIHKTFGFHNVMIFMVDDSRGNLELKAQASRYASPIQVQERVKLSDGVIGRVFSSGLTESIEDVSQEDEYVRWYADTKSELAVPIQIGGVTEGVLNVESDQVRAFSASDRLVLETVAYQLAIAIENARLFGMVKEREDRYRTLVESSPGAVLHLDTEGRLIYANPAASDMTGHPKGQLPAKVKYLQDLAREEYRPAIESAIADALRGKSTELLEFHITHAEGGQRFVTASLQPMISEHGDPKGVVVLARDQTRERQLQDQLNQSEKLSAIGTLVSGVAHELNNPLAGILGFAQLLLARPEEEWGRGDVENIELNARRCQGIVENLLAFARQSRMTKRRANLNKVIDSVLNLNEYQFRMDNIAVERDFDSTIPPFPIDVHRWQQVFINLASNAHQALRQTPDRESRHIRFTTRGREGHVEIRVSDNGPGIPPETRRHIFDPFFTTKASGTGLGLGICFGIVEEHGGTITLDDTVEEGATFVISLPIAETLEYPVAPPPPVRRAASDAGAGLKVLVVDDDTYICDVVSRVLKNHGYTTEIANSGDEALSKLRESAYDLLVSDVRMPGDYDGIDLHDELIAHDESISRRMVFMTGNLLDGRTRNRLDALQVRCLEKPFDIHELAGVINEVAANTSGATRVELPGDGHSKEGGSSRSAAAGGIDASEAATG